LAPYGVHQFLVFVSIGKEDLDWLVVHGP
jgi:hypothetical protein